MNLIWIICLIVFVYYMSASAIGWHLTRQFVFSKSKSLEHTYAKCIENKDFTEEEFLSYELQDFSIESQFDYTLKGVFSPGSDPTKTVVFVHGHTWSWHGQVKYFKLYRERGYNIVAYNHRYHGDSGGQNCSAGYFEKYDLKGITDWALEKFPQTNILGVMGESLGAATSLQFLPLEDRLTFAHVDCPYSDMLELYDYHLGLNHVPKLFRKAAIRYGIAYSKRRAGFDAHEVSPKRAIMETEVPILFIHGDIDDYVPTQMSIDMYEARKDSADTTLVLIKGAKHALSVKVDLAEYKKSVTEFLDRIESIQE